MHDVTIRSEEPQVPDAVDDHIGWLLGIECSYGDGHANEDTVGVIRHFAGS